MFVVTISCLECSTFSHLIQWLGNIKACDLQLNPLQSGFARKVIACKDYFKVYVAVRYIWNGTKLECKSRSQWWTLKLVTKQNVCDGTTFRMDGNMMCRSCINIWLLLRWFMLLNTLKPHCQTNRFLKPFLSNLQCYSLTSVSHYVSAMLAPPFTVLALYVDGWDVAGLWAWSIFCCDCRGTVFAKPEFLSHLKGAGTLGCSASLLDVHSFYHVVNI